MTEDRVEIRRDVVFGRGADRDLRCDVFTPAGPAERRPAVLIIHGGGWRHGDKTQLHGYGIALARAGLVSIATEYRLLGESPWPAQIHDVKAAIRWLRANADQLGVDAGRIAVQGNSAGAHLALFAAGTPADPDYEGDGGHPGVDTAVAAAVAVYPPTRFFFGAPQEGAVPIEALSETPSAALAHEAAPLRLAGAEFPPTMLVHGTGDELVPVGASLHMYEALHRAGVPAELHLFAEQPHAFDAAISFGRRIADLMVLFLERYLAPAAPKPTQRGVGTTTRR